MITFFAGNLLETSTVVFTSQATPGSRLYDRDITLPWLATSNAEQDIFLDQGASPLPFSHLGLFGFTYSTDIQIFSGPEAGSQTLRQTIVGGSPGTAIFPLGGTFSDKVVTIRILAGGLTPAGLELMLGVPHVVGASGKKETRPSRGSSTGFVANVARTRTLSNRLISTELGPGFTRLRYVWNTLPQPDVDVLHAVRVESRNGAKAMLVQDLFGALRFMAWVYDDFAPELVLVNDGVRHYRTEITLESVGA